MVIDSEPTFPEVADLDAALAALQTGSLSLRLAKSAADIEAAQALR